MSKLRALGVIGALVSCCSLLTTPAIAGNPYTCATAAEVSQPAGAVQGHLGGPQVSHFYRIWLWAGDLIVAHGTLDNGDAHFGLNCTTWTHFLNSNGPLVFLVPQDGWWYMNIHAHEYGGQYYVAYGVVPYYV